ncbi:MAG TPA: glycosyltransferase family 4 protein [Rhodanobacter sp.]|nr:glycosyltransferase family 4 protein [Rhodanobacter sp.]
MRFGIVTRYLGHNDGQGRVNFEVAQEARSQGHEVFVFSEEIDAHSSGIDGIRSILCAPPRWMATRLLRDQLFAVRSAALLRDKVNRCDVLLANGFVTWARCDVNAVHFVHNAWLRSPYHPWRLRRTPRSAYALVYSSVNALLEKGAFRRSERVVAVSEKVRHDLIEIGIASERIATIGNGVDTIEFTPGSSERALFGLPLDKTVALFAGDLMTPRKNLETVLRAMQHVPDLYLAVAGRVEGSVYPALACSLDVADRVRFLGFRSDMPTLMRSVDLFVLPSHYEPFGLVLLEALASGLPVVTARSVGGSNMIGPAVGVTLEDSDNEMALAAVLRDLARSLERRRSMGAEARALAERYSWPAMARQYVDLLVEMAEVRRHGTDV